MKKLIPIIIAALIFTFYVHPSYSTPREPITAYKLSAGPYAISPIAVYISCGGKPVALIISSSYGYVAGDVYQVSNHMKAEEGIASLEEADQANTLANIDLSTRDWIECRVK